MWTLRNKWFRFNNNIQPTVVKKDGKQRLIKQQAKKAIDQTPNATDEEKATAKAKVDEAVTIAKNAIDVTNNGCRHCETNGRFNQQSTNGC